MINDTNSYGTLPGLTRIAFSLGHDYGRNYGHVTVNLLMAVLGPMLWRLPKMFVDLARRAISVLKSMCAQITNVQGSKDCRKMVKERLWLCTWFLRALSTP